ncbi:MAG TPA: hypothetical protein VKZ53_17160 [Candidatus Angelobacter sp.]|nr:hypothetical protein [Candidatus Angelobacter sp.]
MFSSLAIPPAISKGQLEDTAGQAFNDPLSNVVYLGTTLSRREVLRQFQDGTYPIDCLDPFLHEGTHHRCFDSPTGYALLGIESFSRASWWETLKCRAQRGDKSDCAGNPTCFNRALLRAIYQLLTPLAEGLALYGELDAAPGASTAASSMLLNSLPVFFYKKMVEILSAGQGIERVYSDFKNYVDAERTRENSMFARTRKALEQSDGINAYQTGYRFIKDLTRFLHRHSAAASNDLDVTLGFLCSFFFDDWVFATMIAGASWSITMGAPSATLSDIAEYLRKRIVELRQPTISMMFDQYAAALATGETTQCDFLHYSRARLEQLSLFNAQAGATELYWRAPKTTQHRHILRVATMIADTVTLNVSNATFLAMIDGVRIQGPGLKDGFPVHPEQSKLEAHGSDTAVELLLVNHQLLACIFYGGNLIAVLDRQFNPIDPDLAEKALGDLSSFTEAESWRRHHWELLNPSLDTTCGAYLEGRLKEAEDWTAVLYA